MHEIRPHAQTYMGTWYVSTIVPEKQRRALNKEIASLRVDGTVKKILADFLQDLGAQACGKGTPPKIDGNVLGTLFVALLGLPFSCLIAALVVGLILERLSLPDIRNFV